jgi:hypothetical protein
VSKIRWLRLPLVLLLGPVVYYLVWYGIGEWQKPVSLYTVTMPGNQECKYAARVQGECWYYYCPRENEPAGEAPKQYHRLNDGTTLKATNDIVPRMQFEEQFNLIQKHYVWNAQGLDPRENKSRLEDSLTGRTYPLPAWVDHWWGRAQTNHNSSLILVKHSWDACLACQSLLSCLAPPPAPAFRQLLSIATIPMNAERLRNTELLTVLSIPDCRVVVSDVVNPFTAVISYQHHGYFVRALSPSGRWIVSGEFTAGRQGNIHATHLWLFDTRLHYWKKLCELDGKVDEMDFLSDEVLMATVVPEKYGPKTRIAMSVPQGQPFDQYSEDLSSLKFPSIDVAGNCYVRASRETDQPLSQLCTGRLTTEGFQLVLQKMLPYEAGTVEVGAAHQLLITRPSLLSYQTLPDWTKRWLPERWYDWGNRWLNRHRDVLYDSVRDQVICQWPQGYHGAVSSHGNYLVMSQLGEDDRLLSVSVYSLPFPVWSPWWAHGTATIATLLFAAWLMRRRSTTKTLPARHLSPSPYNSPS